MRWLWRAWISCRGSWFVVRFRSRSHFLFYPPFVSCYFVFGFPFLFFSWFFLWLVCVLHNVLFCGLCFVFDVRVTGFPVVVRVPFPFLFPFPFLTVCVLFSFLGFSFSFVNLCLFFFLFLFGVRVWHFMLPSDCLSWLFCFLFSFLFCSFRFFLFCFRFRFSFFVFLLCLCVCMCTCACFIEVRGVIFLSGVFSFLCCSLFLSCRFSFCFLICLFPFSFSLICWFFVYFLFGFSFV